MLGMCQLLNVIPRSLPFLSVILRVEEPIASAMGKCFYFCFYFENFPIWQVPVTVMFMLGVFVVAKKYGFRSFILYDINKSYSKIHI